MENGLLMLNIAGATRIAIPKTNVTGFRNMFLAMVLFSNVFTEFHFPQILRFKRLKQQQSSDHVNEVLWKYTNYISNFTGNPVAL